VSTEIFSVRKKSVPDVREAIARGEAPNENPRSAQIQPAAGLSSTALLQDFFALFAFLADRLSGQI